MRASFGLPLPSPMRPLLLVLLFLPAAASAQSAPTSARAVMSAAAAAGATADPTAREAAVEALWTSLRAGQAASRVPFVAADSAVFLWRGSAATVSVAGDHTGWQTNRAPLVRQGQSDLWLRLDRFDPAARIDYKIVVGGSNWILDPANPNRQASGFGPNSELRMPGWAAEPLTVRDAATPRGTLGPALTLASTRYTTAPVTVRVWTPAGYDAGTDRLPVVYVTDGHEYADDALGAVTIVLDNLVAARRIEPVIAVFIDPRAGGQNRRQEQYVTNPAFAAFVATELVPRVDRDSRTRPDRASRASLGTSLGGLFSAYLGTAHPDTFGLLGIHSPAFQASETVYTLVDLAPAGAFRVAMTTGTINDTQAAAQRMRTVMTARGHAVTYREVPEGHSWGNWRALIDDVLVPFFPPRPATDTGATAPVETGLRLDAVPNPTNAAGAQLRLTLGASAPARLACFDAQGRTVATLADVAATAGRTDIPLGGWHFAPGVYACRVTSGSVAATETLTVLP